MNDFRYALRMLLKSPAFSIIAITTLALGIGANTAIFSVIESALLRPLPFPKADRLVRLYETFEENGARSDLLNLAEKTVRQWREYGSDIFEGIGVATGAGVTATNPGQPAQSFQAARISANFLKCTWPSAGSRTEFHCGGGSTRRSARCHCWLRFLATKPRRTRGRSGTHRQTRRRLVHYCWRDAENFSSSVSRSDLVTDRSYFRSFWSAQSLSLRSGAASTGNQSCAG